MYGILKTREEEEVSVERNRIQEEVLLFYMISNEEIVLDVKNPEDDEEEEVSVQRNRIREEIVLIVRKPEDKEVLVVRDHEDEEKKNEEI